MTSTETSFERGSQRSVTSRPFWFRWASSLKAACDIEVPFRWLICDFTRRSCVAVRAGRAGGDPTPTPDLFRRLELSLGSIGALSYVSRCGAMPGAASAVARLQSPDVDEVGA